MESIMLEDKLKSFQRSKGSLKKQLNKTKENMLIIIDQYKEKVNLVANHRQMLRDEQAKVSALRVEREAMEEVIELFHKEGMKWMDRFALTLNESQELLKLLARAKTVADTYSAPDEVHSLFNYCQHMKQMNADMEATKEQMTTMMEAKMSIRKMMEVNTTTIIVTSTATKVDPTNPFGLNQVNHPVLDMVGQGGKALESTSDPHFVQPRPTANPNPNTNTNPQRNLPTRKLIEFTQIPMSVPGHSVKQCAAFKHKVQSLIDAGWLTFQEDSPNVRTNPLENHESSSVNAIKRGESQELEKIEEVLTPRRFILEALSKVGMCPFHPGELHDVETYPVSEELLQGLIDEGRIEIGRVRREEGEVFMQSSDTNLSKPKPLVIHFTKNATTSVPRGFRPAVVRAPSPFPYKSDKVVPWMYGV
ncbi:hypothetical protein GmHk_18G051703 [Glycine max]|nr:hypothetical protein GmHk_18G051703 [Glycine max]